MQGRLSRRAACGRRRKSYGKSVALDLHFCNPESFNRRDIDWYFRELCDLIAMVKCKRVWWDDVGVPDADKQTSDHTTGTSAVQFILTSTIVVHTLNKLGNVYVDCFSCKVFDEKLVADFTAMFFGGKVVTCAPTVRK